MPSTDEFEAEVRRDFTLLPKLRRKLLEIARLLQEQRILNEIAAPWRVVSSKQNDLLLGILKLLSEL
jgi:hypothetical protein